MFDNGSSRDYYEVKKSWSSLARAGEEPSVCLFWQQPPLLFLLEMIRIRIKATGEIREATRNEAFDLIDRGVAELFKGHPVPVYKVEQERENLYTNRQMRTSGNGMVPDKDRPGK